MAYMSQEHKKKINKILKGIVPKTWKWSLSVNNHSTICMTVWSGPAALAIHPRTGESVGYLDVNRFYPENYYRGELLTIVQNILEALNTDNYDHSEPMSDYHCVGHYVNFKIGRWDKAFKPTGDVLDDGYNDWVEKVRKSAMSISGIDIGMFKPFPYRFYFENNHSPDYTAYCVVTDNGVKVP